MLPVFSIAPQHLTSSHSFPPLLPPASSGSLAFHSRPRRCLWWKTTCTCTSSPGNSTFCPGGRSPKRIRIHASSTSFYEALESTISFPATEIAPCMVSSPRTGLAPTPLLLALQHLTMLSITSFRELGCKGCTDTTLFCFSPIPWLLLFAPRWAFLSSPQPPNVNAAQGHPPDLCLCRLPLWPALLPSPHLP